MKIKSIFLKNIYVWIFFFSAIFFSNICFSQTNLKKLEKKRAENQREIRYANDLLRSTLKSKHTSIGALKLLKKKIKIRNSFLRNIDDELVGINSKITFLEDNVDSLNVQISHLKSTYAELAYQTFKKRNSYNKLMFIMSSDNFSQAYRRYKYYQQISEYSKNQVALIKQKSKLLLVEKKSLQTIKLSKTKLQHVKLLEKSELDKEKKQKSGVLLNLQNKEHQLRTSLQKREKESQKLSVEIKKIIRLQANKKSKNSKFKKTNTYVQLSKSFAANRKKLPWPSNNGYISSKFGVHKHPVLKYVKVKNDGIDITTKKNSICLSIFKGVVEQVISIPGLNKVVIISHGDYYTVYSNLVKVSVTPTQSVKIGQKLGVIAENGDHKETVLKLQIWKLSHKLDPAIWLRKN